MKIARVKAIHDPSVGLVQAYGLVADGPLTRKRPVVERQTCRRCIDTASIRFDAARRREVLRALVPEIVFWRLQVGPVGRPFHAADSSRLDTAAWTGSASVHQQLSNLVLRLFVLTLAEVTIADASTRVDEVQGGPVLIPE